MTVLLVYVAPLAIAAAFGLALAGHLLRIRHTPGTRSLMALILSASLWSAGYAIEFLSPVLSAKLLWAKIQYVGIVALPLAWYFFTRRYLQSDRWRPGQRLAWVLLSILPLLTLALVWSNDLHHLVWREVRLNTAGSIPILELEHGPWFWVFWVFTYVLLLSGAVLLSRTLLGSVRLYGWQIRLALLAMGIPWISNVIYVSGINPIPHLDWTPFAFVLSALLLTISLFRYQLVDILPIAHQQVFNGQADALLVLDSQDRIVDVNPAAQKMAPGAPRQTLGTPFTEAFPDLASQLQPANLAQETHLEIAPGDKPGREYYDLHVSPLTGAGQEPVGRLVVLHNITPLKQEQARLEEVIARRTEELRQSVERLQVELRNRTLAEKRLEAVVESAPDAMLLVDQAGVIRLLNAQAERLFGYSRAEVLGQPIDLLIPEKREGQDGQTTVLNANSAIRHIRAGRGFNARRKNGSLFPAEVSLGPLDTAEGLWAACNVRDISDRVETEAQQQRLLDEVNRSREQLSALAGRLQEVQEIERRQIASELHDRIGQNLIGLNLNLQIIENQLGADCSESLRSRLADSGRLVEETTRQIRDVMADLHPPVLDDYGLVSSLNWYSDLFAQRTGITCQVSGMEFKPRLPANVEIALFRLAQEALTNIAKHAHATQVDILVESASETPSITVLDDGQGFDLRAQGSRPAEPHWGLLQMQQRAASIGAQLEISSAPGHGTRVCIHFQRGQDEHSRISG